MADVAPRSEGFRAEAVPGRKPIGRGRAMTRIAKLVTIAGLVLLQANCGLAAWAQTPDSREVLGYRTPAPVWDHALPIGNGRLGAMVFAAPMQARTTGTCRL